MTTEQVQIIGVGGGFVVALIVAGWTHELGHALASWSLGQHVELLRFGSGPWRTVLRKRAPQVVMAWPMPLGGLCRSLAPSAGVSVWQRTLQIGSGLALNLLLALLLAFCAWWQSSRIALLLGLAQGVVGLSQLLPLRGHDGLDLWRLWRKAA